MKREWFVSPTVAEMNKSRVSADGTLKAVCANPADVHKELVVIATRAGLRILSTVFTQSKQRTQKEEYMNGKLAFVLIFAAALLTPGFAAAGPGGPDATDFQVETTQNLINLCTAPADHKLAKEAAHFCEGYLVGAFHYYLAENSGPASVPLVCLPDPPPSRNQALTMFLEWAKGHPQCMNEVPVETEFRFLTEKWPCKK